MLCVWSKIGQTEPIEKEMFIWYNQELTVEKKLLFYPEFYNMGIKYVSDLYDDTGKLIPFRYWQNKGVRPSYFIKWAGLVSVVSSKLKQKIKWGQETEENVLNIKGETAQCPIKNASTKYVYEQLVNLNGGRSVTVPKIISYIDNLKEPATWETVYRMVHSVMDTATRVFQFKFLHDILVNNYWLCKWKIKNDSWCDFCHECVEDINHMFWNCMCTRKALLERFS